jgi:hypothetical protein
LFRTQPLPAYRKAAEALGFRNARLLQKWQRATLRAEKTNFALTVRFAPFLRTLGIPLGTPRSVNVSKAVEINESFEVSKQFWSFLVEEGVIASPDLFIRQVHLSFVRGEDNVDFLRKRYEELGKHHLFFKMHRRPRAGVLRTAPSKNSVPSTACPGLEVALAGT